jgi:uncharacterized protein YabE (DUF348 family)
VFYARSDFSNSRGGIILRRNILAAPKQIKHSFTSSLVWWSGLVLLSILLFSLIGSRVLANDGTVVNLYVENGEARTITTQATTVGELLKRAGVEVDENDLVEPSLETSFDSAIFNINVYRGKPYLIIDGEKSVSVKSAYQSPKLIVEKSAGLKTYQEDAYSIELIRDFIENDGIGYQITIDRAVPIMLEVDGASLNMRTQQETVGALLEEKGIKLSSEDKLNIDKTENLTPGMKIVVTRVGHEVVAKEEAIPFQTLVTYDDGKPAGFEEIVQAGKNGRKLVTYEVKKHNGVAVEREVLQTVIAAEPVSKKVIRGTKTSGGTWEALRNCESGGNYANKNNPTYRGAYQFDQSTWDSNAPAGYAGVDPADAPPHIQDQAAQTLQSRRGWSPWPSCASKLGLI